MTALQLPVFDVPTWFLMCLVVVECIHYAVFRFLRGSDARILVAVVLFYLAGYALNSRFQFFQPGNYALPNWWICLRGNYHVRALLGGRAGAAVGLALR